MFGHLMDGRLRRLDCQRCENQRKASFDGMVTSAGARLPTLTRAGRTQARGQVRMWSSRDLPRAGRSGLCPTILFTAVKAHRTWPPQYTVKLGITWIRGNDATSGEPCRVPSAPPNTAVPVQSIPGSSDRHKGRTKITTLHGKRARMLPKGDMRSKPWIEPIEDRNVDIGF